jgi:uncharacterized protein (DUF1499 family)
MHCDAITRRAALSACLLALPRWQQQPATAASPPDGLFPDCSSSCVSSQDDRPAVFDNPWVAEEPLPRAMQRLKAQVMRLKGRVLEEEERYLRAEFAAKGPLGESVDEAEFFFTPNDVLVQFRAARRGGAPDFGANRQRMEKARIALGWEKVEVLRNRRRALVVVESPFDTFGPGMYEKDELGFTNRDMVPAEASQKEMYRDVDPLAAPWVKPSRSMIDRGLEGLGEAVRREADDRVRSK